MATTTETRPPRVPPSPNSMAARFSARRASFDPDSADAAKLYAYEQVRALRAAAYAFDNLPDAQAAPETEAADEQMEVAERIVQGDRATTIPGVIARLLLLTPSVDPDRWIDRGLAEQGFLALYHQRGKLSGHAQQLVLAVHELLHIEWQQNLANYERSEDDFSLAIKGKGLVEEVAFGGDSSVFVQAMQDHTDACEDRYCNSAIVRKLIRTLTPDHDAYLRKVDIISAEGWGQVEDVARWLARDTSFLVGRIQTDERSEA